MMMLLFVFVIVILLEFVRMVFLLFKYLFWCSIKYKIMLNVVNSNKIVKIVKNFLLGVIDENIDWEGGGFCFCNLLYFCIVVY